MIGIICEDSRECFAKHKALDGTMHCKILSGGYPGNTCPFQKDPAQIKSVSREELERVKAARRRSLAKRMEEDP